MDFATTSADPKIFPVEASDVAGKVMLAMVHAADIAAPVIYGWMLQGTGPLGTVLLILLVPTYGTLVAQHFRKLIRFSQRFELIGEQLTLISPFGAKTLDANRLTVRRHWIARHWFWGLSPDGSAVKLPRPDPCEEFYEAVEKEGAVIEAGAWTKQHRGLQ